MINTVELMPVTADSYPFCSAARYGYLQDAGYEEKEYYISGRSNVYQTLKQGKIGVRTADAPYTNRIVVRCPKDPAAFSGNVIVEIINPTSFMDLERIWVLSMKEILRSGDIYVGITSKPNTIPALLAFNSERYSRMDWSNPTPEEPFPFTTEDIAGCGNLLPDQNIGYETGLFWDMLTDLPDLLRRDCDLNPLRAYAVKNIVLAGWSQSGDYLIRYANDFAYLKDREYPVYDGYFAAGPPRYLPIPVNQYETVSCAKGDWVQLNHMKQPCIICQTESENAVLGGWKIVKREGTGRDFKCRHYEITGASHDSQYSLLDYYKGDPDLARIGFLFGYGGKDAEPNHYPYQLLVNAMIRNLFTWIDTGVAPQPCRKIDTDGSECNLKDAFGNSTGGIRTCLLNFPTGRYIQYSNIEFGSSGIFPNSDKDWLFGHEEAFSADMLKELYQSLNHYRELVEKDTEELVASGLLLKDDAEAMVEEAVSRAEARGLH